MDSPYRSADIRPDATPLVRSWWSLAMSVLFTLGLGAFAYIILRYVAGGWIGYAIGGLVGFLALVSAREIGGGKLGYCPKCDAPIETHGPREGYLCPKCTTFLEVDRNQLVASPSDRVAALCRFGVQYDGELVLPDRCCVCLEPATRHMPIRILDKPVDLPYCAKHDRGAIARSRSRNIMFRSFAYATLVRDATKGRFVGAAPAPASAGERWFGFWAGVILSSLAAGTYWGLAAMDRAGVEIVPTSIRGFFVWLVIKLLGRLWVTTVLAGLGAVFFGLFLSSFKPQRAKRDGQRPR